MKVLILSLFSIALLMSCKNKKGAIEAGSQTYEAFEQVVDTDSLLLAYERGVCFGQCPQDKIIIYKSGFAVYEGVKNVDIVGKANNTIKKEDLDKIRELIDAIDVKSLDNKFGMQPSDIPSKTITFNLGDQRKTIEYKSTDKEEIRSLVTELKATIDQYFMY